MKTPNKRRAAIIAGVAGLAIALPSAAFAATAASASPLEGALTIDSSSTWYASGQFVLKNTTTEKQDWTLQFTVPEGSFQNSSSWNIDATVVGDQVTLTPKNGGLAGGQSEHISFGVAGDGTGKLVLEGCDLNGSDVAGCSAGDGEEDTEKPSTPTNLTADTVDSSTIHVMWEHSTDNVKVAGYRIVQDGDVVKELPGNMRMTNITGLAAGTSYDYEVEAFDAADNVSDRTDVVTGTTAGAPVEDTEAPSDVTEIAAKATGPRTVDVTWGAATDNVGVTSYVINDGKGGSKTVSGSATSETITGLLPETDYVFSVHPVDAAGNTGGSQLAHATTLEDVVVEPGTGTPTDFTAAAGTYQDGSTTMHRLKLGWTPADATKRYEIYIDGVYAQTLLIGSDQAAPQKRNVELGSESGTHTVKLRAQLADGSWSAFTPELSVTN
ncbi:fibronectin type III domain-containing protein [Plantibacter sp. YIM 135347]|uniref:fibronectin type III domain-containing protein n=1 Tax=Plantibacter sp. YIM 135347 TaxID=3423919 RepID=UPI003D339717